MSQERSSETLFVINSNDIGKSLETVMDGIRPWEMKIDPVIVQPQDVGIAMETVYHDGNPLALGYSAWTQEHDGVVATGKTIDTTFRNMRVALQVYRNELAKDEQ